MKKLISALVLSSLLTLASAAFAGTDVPVVVTLDSSAPGPKIADDYAGFSYETKREMPDAQGKYYFSPQNTALIKMFQTLGIQNLRIGGNTVDSSKVTIPVQADIDQLFQFAKAADTKVIYSFRLNKGDPQASAGQAKYIADNYAAQLVCFSIGNESDIYVHSYPSYLKNWQPIYDAINKAVPNAIFLGPSLTSNAHPWAHDFARDYYPSGKILYITQHQYAGGAGGKITDPVYGRGLMLSPEWQKKYQDYYDKFGAPLLAQKVPYRLEEANNFYNGGAKDVSDTYASALWGLDYLYWWAAHGSQGINFHNGDEVAAGQQIAPCRYASFTTAPDGYFAHPLAYTIKLFNLGSRGQIIGSATTSDASTAEPQLRQLRRPRRGQKSLRDAHQQRERRDGARCHRDDQVTRTSATSPKSTPCPWSPQATTSPPRKDCSSAARPSRTTEAGPESWTPVSTSGPIQIKVPAGSIMLVRITGS